MYESPAHEICDNLGFTPEEAQVSAENVAARIDRVDNWREERTSALLAGQERVHLHQLATGSNGDTWIILGLNNDTVELTRVEGPMDGGDVGFMEDRTVSHGEFIMNYEAQTEVLVNGETVPVWGY